MIQPQADWPLIISIAALAAGLLGVFVGPNEVGRLVCGCLAWASLVAIYFLLPVVKEMPLAPRLLIPSGATILAIGIAWVPVGRMLSPALSGSFTEMVQLITLKNNETFHGVVPARNFSTTLVFVQVVVQNDGTPSIADDWSMWLTIGGEDVKADGVPVPDFTYRLNPTSPAIEYSQQEAIYNVSVRKPITVDAPIRGFYIGRFDVVHNRVSDNLDSLRLRFKDRMGAVYETVRKKRGRLRPDAEFVPGIGKIVP